MGGSKLRTDIGRGRGWVRKTGQSNLIRKLKLIKQIRI